VQEHVAEAVAAVAGVAAEGVDDAGLAVGVERGLDEADQVVAVEQQARAPGVRANMAVKVARSAMWVPGTPVKARASRA